MSDDPLAAALAWADLCRPDNPTAEVGRMTQDQIESRCLDAIEVLAAEVRRVTAEAERVKAMDREDFIEEHEARLQAEAALAAERIENAKLREAFVMMEKAYNQNETALREQRCETCRHQMFADGDPEPACGLTNESPDCYLYCRLFGNGCRAWARGEL